MANKTPQEFVVLRCKQCNMFQVHQSKKSTKFSCRVCGEQQSIAKVWSKGSSVECRRTVQRLNSRCADAGDESVDEELMKYEDELYERRVDNARAFDDDVQEAQQVLQDLEDEEDNNYDGMEQREADDAATNGGGDTASRHVPIDYSQKSGAVNFSPTATANGSTTITDDNEMVDSEQGAPEAKRSRFDLFPD